MSFIVAETVTPWPLTEAPEATEASFFPTDFGAPLEPVDAFYDRPLPTTPDGEPVAAEDWAVSLVLQSGSWNPFR